MVNPVVVRVGAVARGAFRLVEDTFSIRLLVAALALRRRAPAPFLMLATCLALCLGLAGRSAVMVFATLSGAAGGWFWPGLAALVVFLAVLELCSAAVMSGVAALLRLSYDIGRHRIGTLLTMLALAWAGLALLSLKAAAPGLALSCALALALALIALWFDRAYRRPAYPRFRDFHADVVAARAHLTRTAHGG